MPSRTYRSYNQCQVGNGEVSKNVYVPTEFARMDRKVRVLEDSVDTPSESFDSDEWGFWAIESVGVMTMADALTAEQKQQVKVER